MFLKISRKNIRDVVFNLIKVQAKCLQLYCKETPHMYFRKNFADVLRTPILYSIFKDRHTVSSEISSKNQNNSTG